MDKALAGSKFNRWTVIDAEGRHRIVRCECGTAGRVLKGDLVAGRSRMCNACRYASKRGIKRPEITKHGLSDSPTQRTWSDMKRRCYSKHRRDFANYGGRGIRVCRRWLLGDRKRSGFECFVADMGVRPSLNHQIERTDNDGHYEPNNCRWALKDEQNYNKRNTFRFVAFGREFNLKQAEREYGVPSRVLFQRLVTRRMKPERALLQPLRH